ncbi:hypothetical protein D3C81_1310000 [compost metagenome]
MPKARSLLAISPMMRMPRQVMSAAKKPITAHSGSWAVAGSQDDIPYAAAAPNAQPRVNQRQFMRSISTTASSVPSR